MLATVYAPDEVTYAWLGSIVRVEKDEKDPNVRYVWGKATDGTLDSDEQIVDPEFAKKAMAEWYESAANVRQMHSTNIPPAGKGVLLQSQTDGEWVRSKVVEPSAVKLVDEGVYTGYSVGISRPRIVRDTKARGGRIVAGKIVEISLVDRPANPMAKFVALKMERGHLDYVGKVAVLGEPESSEVEPLPAVEKVTDGLELLRRGRTVVVETTDGETVTGVVVRKSATAIRLNTRAYDAFRDEVAIAMDDIVAVRKRDFDPNVGGGVDRDKMPASDFIDPKGRRFPIHKPGDVSDVVHSFGRADPPIPMDKFRSRLTAIARRKGPEFVAQLPDSWPGGATKAAGITHDHEHTHPGGITHSHPHTHAPNHGDHSNAHAHGHPETEDSVTDAQTAAADTTKAAAEADDAPKCPTCDGTGKAEGGTDPCPTCDGTGKAPWEKAADADATKAADGAAPTTDTEPLGEAVGPKPKKPRKPKGKTAKAQAKKADKPFPGAAAPFKAKDGDGDGDGDDDSAPAGPYKTPPDADNVGAAAGDDTQAQPEPPAKARPFGKKMAKAAKKAAKKASKSVKVPATDDDTPYLLKRLHDFTCAAYEPASVAEFYPSIEKNGVAAAMGPGAKAAVYAMLANEVQNDAGAGDEADHIKNLAKAYDALCDFLDGEADEEKIGKIDAARAELFELFKTENADTFQTGAYSPGDYPKPAETITAGEFKRPYLSAGHQQEKATEHSPDLTPDTHPISASSYTRGPLTAGHQAYITNKLAALHDGLADWRPELCRMSAMGPDGSFAQTRQPAETFERGGLRKLVDDGQDARPQRAVMPATNKAPGEKSDSLSSDSISKMVTEAVTQATAPLLTKIQQLENEFGSQPDPQRSAVRGVTAGGAQKNAKPDLTKAQQKAARKARRREEQVSYLTSLAQSPDAEVRVRAQRKLTGMGVALDY